jgi:transcription-repair coupling factor (superfamily II helicase)
MSLQEIIQRVLDSHKFVTALNNSKNALTLGQNYGIERIHGILKSIFITCISKEWKKIFVLTKTPEEIAEGIKMYIEERYKVFCIPEYNNIENLALEEKSEIFAPLSVLLKWRKKQKNQDNEIVVAPYIENLPLPYEIEKKMLLLKKNSNQELSILVKKLSNIGFTRVGTVENMGEFAVRGGIIDLWGYGMEVPIRIEFFGDSISSIREFDPFLQTSVSKLEEVTILPINFDSHSTSIIDYIPQNIPLILDEISLLYLNSSFSKYIHFGEGYPVDSLPSYQGNIKEFNKIIEELKGYDMFVICKNETQEARVRELINKNSLHFIHTKAFTSGFILPDANIGVFTYSDIFGHKIKAPRYPHPFKGEGIKIENLSLLEPQDIVVHIDYGIGVYHGIKRICIDHIETDCLVIEYKGGDKLYVPVEKFNLIEKWVSTKDEPPPLSSLDSYAWERRKRQTRKFIQNMTHELLNLYAERKLAKGYKFSPDTVWQAELESNFPYEETEGQVRVIEEVKKDMESDFPMDRLVCGEVGYGKTEVALRAAFKAVMDGKQVALLCPTTILVEQHTRRFRARLQEFPILVEQLSRFQGKEKQKKVIELLKQGKVDIIIGTHRLLSQDIKFKDLGLLIIDEEHKFGVAQKEKFKKLKKDLDILSLTATPIPRTLYMALSNIKDVSRLDTPPYGRQPITTQVSVWSDYLIEKAILRELSRDGQVYFIHNRIENIEEIASKIKNMNPTFKVAVTHAKLSTRKLETIMLKFLDGEFNVLVTTAIIGSGIDIPRVNTIIINRADQFGLAELHQLRGRVGRGDKHAYCYLLVPRKLTPLARKRLQTIVTHTELGAGFKLALRDLEIRGAGNLLGREQHGHIHRIGYELYMRLLEEEIKKIKGEKITKEIEPEINIKISAYIPNWYADPARKLEIYKRLANCNTIGQIEEFKKELMDRFGLPPSPVETLLSIAKIRILAKRKKIIKINSLNKKEFELLFLKSSQKLVPPENIKYVESTEEGTVVKVEVDGIEGLKRVLS